MKEQKLKLNLFKEGSFFNIPFKFWEVQLTTFDEYNSYFKILIKWTRQCDHAGFNLTIELFSLYFCFQVYDSRHWNYGSNEYEIC